MYRLPRYHKRAAFGRVCLMAAVLSMVLSLGAVVEAHAQAWGAVRGTVVAQKDGTPLADASVFLSGTLLGTATDTTGAFVISRIPPGVYDLAASLLGYQTYVEEQQIDAGDTLTVDIVLAARVITLGGVEVVEERSHEWNDQADAFEEAFLGQTSNARACELTTRENLVFERQDGTLLAHSVRPVVVVNRALGYEITFFLQDFRYDGEHVRYRGVHFYTELDPQNDRERRRWERRREEAYRGSFQHFTSALANHRLIDEGFEVHWHEGGDLAEQRRPGNSYAPRARRRPSVTADELLVPGAQPATYALDFNGLIRVTFHGEDADPNYAVTTDRFVDPVYANTREQVSWIERDHRFDGTLTEDGLLKNPYAAVLYGYMGWERFCDTLPRDYVINHAAK